MPLSSSTSRAAARRLSSLARIGYRRRKQRLCVREDRCLLAIRFIQIALRPLPNNTPRRKSKRLFANLSPPAKDALWAMPPLNKPGFKRPACSLPPAPIPLSDPHAPVELPNRGAALAVQYGRYLAVPATPRWVYRLCCLSTILITACVPLLAHHSRCFATILRPGHGHRLLVLVCGEAVSLSDWAWSGRTRPQEGEPDLRQVERPLRRQDTITLLPAATR